MKEVYFAQNDHFSEASISTFEGKQHLSLSCYDKVAEFPQEIDQEEIFFRTQNIDEPWSPSRFRSMSVGDLIHDTETDQTIICCGVGFEEYKGLTEENINCLKSVMQEITDELIQKSRERQDRQDSYTGEKTQ